MDFSFFCTLFNSKYAPQLKEEHKKWYSPTLSMDIEMLIFGHYGHPVIIFPTTKGRYYESKDFKLIESVAHLIDAGKVKIYCPDSVDAYSLYNKSIHPADRIRNHRYYIDFMKNEVVNAIRSAYHIPKVAVAGASFGGYHAANFAFSNPDMVSHLFSMSAKFDIRDFMDGFYNDDVYFCNPVDYLPGSNHPDLWQMKIVLGYGEWDICRDANLHMSHLLNEKHIPHWLDERRWAKHDWPIWRDMFPDYLSQL